MDDKEYEEIKKKIINQENFPDKTVNNIRWDFGFLTLIKDKNNKQDVINLMNSVQQHSCHRAFDLTLNLLSKEYIKIEDIPSVSEIFGMIKNRIDDNLSSIEYNNKELFKLNKNLIKAKDNDEMTKIKSSIFWAEHSVDNSKKEISFYNHISDCLKYNVRTQKFRDKRGRLK